MKIEIPEGYQLPDNTQDGDTIEELVTFRVEGDYIVPMKVAGIEITSSESEDSSEDKTEDMAEGETEAAPAKKGKAAAMAAGPMGEMGKRIMGMA